MLLNLWKTFQSHFNDILINSIIVHTQQHSPECVSKYNNIYTKEANAPWFMLLKTFVHWSNDTVIQWSCWDGSLIPKYQGDRSALAPLTENLKLASPSLEWRSLPSHWDERTQGKIYDHAFISQLLTYSQP